jgi:hypothetical protein
MNKYLTLLICLLTLTWCSLIGSPSEPIINSWSITNWATTTDQIPTWVDLLSWQIDSPSELDSVLVSYGINKHNFKVITGSSFKWMKWYSLVPISESQTCWQWSRDEPCWNIIIDSTGAIRYSSVPLEIIQWLNKETNISLIRQTLQQSWNNTMSLWYFTWETIAVYQQREGWWSADWDIFNWEMCKIFWWGWSDSKLYINITNNKKIIQTETTTRDVVECIKNKEFNKDITVTTVIYSWVINKTQNTLLWEDKIIEYLK